MSDKTKRIITTICTIIVICFAAFYAYVDDICGTIFAGLAMVAMVYLTKNSN